jgi:undecaprenyl-diphosphatase
MFLLRSRNGLVAAVLVLAAGAARAGDPAEPRCAMTLGQAVTLGLVEGLTEFLPVSSTGHLFIVERVMGLASDEAEQSVSDSFGIAIQLGAILAVVGLYFGRIRSMALGVVNRDPAGRRLVFRLLLAFLPAVVLALLFQNWIRQRLFGPWPIVIAWAAGGLAILAACRWLRGHPRMTSDIEDLGARAALWIGLAQCLALWPGVSRSLVTIAGGLAAGLRPRAAVEFSFLLGLVTLGAATAYEMAVAGGAIVQLFGWWRPMAGLATACASAWLSMRWMVQYLQRHGFALFGWYRLAIAALAAALIGGGRLG